jgi:type VI protein secretion system component VasF
MGAIRLYADWREGYAQLVGANAGQVQHVAPQAQAPKNAQHLPRLNLLVTHTVATFAVLAVVLLQLIWASRS